jgi:serine/threonine protein phosphatase PrpC
VNGGLNLSRALGDL